MKWIPSLTFTMPLCHTSKHMQWYFISFLRYISTFKTFQSPPSEYYSPSQQTVVFSFKPLTKPQAVGPYSALTERLPRKLLCLWRKIVQIHSSSYHQVWDKKNNNNLKLRIYVLCVLNTTEGHHTLNVITKIFFKWRKWEIKTKAILT